MCIIIVKPAGIAFPTEAVLRNCWSSNRDGFGAMYRKEDGKIQIEKGYMTLNEVLNWRARHAASLLNTDVVMHFRLSTHGGVSAGNTHPFPITDHIGDLRRLNFVCDRAIAHNGILNEFGRAKSSLSDTMIFVKHLAGMNAPTFIGSAISKQTGKFVYMNGTDTIMFGIFNEENGIFYSNYSYRTSGVTVYSSCAGSPSFLPEEEDVYESTCSRECASCETDKRDNCIWAKCDHDCGNCKFEPCVYEVEYYKHRERDAKRKREFDREQEFNESCVSPDDVKQVDP